MQLKRMIWRFNTSVILLMASTVVFAAKYTIVIDAGSSGSRLHVYQYQPLTKTNKLTIKEIGVIKKQPGISEYIKQKKPLTAYLKPLIDFAKTKVPEDQQAQTSLGWYSTAGMRLLPESLQQSAYQQITHYVQQHSTFKLAGAKTISGAMEGALLWLSESYTANSHNVGVLDMGGASTQIVFPVMRSQKIATVAVNLAGKMLYLYSKSYLGLGRNELRDRYQNDAACFANNYQLPNGKPAQGNFAQCKLSVMQPLSMQYKVKQQTPPLPQQLQFVGFSGFALTAMRLGLKDDFTITKLRQKGVEQCQTAWTGARAANKDNFKNCFNTAYFTALLSDYGFKPQQTIKVGSNLSWALGSAILAASNGSIQSI